MKLTREALGAWAVAAMILTFATPAAAFSTLGLRIESVEATLQGTNFKITGSKTVQYGGSSYLVVSFESDVEGLHLTSNDSGTVIGEAITYFPPHAEALNSEYSLGVLKAYPVLTTSSASPGTTLRVAREDDVTQSSLWIYDIQGDTMLVYTDAYCLDTSKDFLHDVLAPRFADEAFEKVKNHVVSP